MNWRSIIVIAASAACLNAAEPKKAAAPVDKAALAPFANDLGPADIDVSKYPAEHQKTYKELLPKCSKCHSVARVLNSQFVELSAPDLEAEKKTNPDILKDPALIQVEAEIWKRYVKRMMAKPGCDIAPPDGKAIWQFLAYDGKKRKTGKNFAAWKAQRLKLLEQFKSKYPERYAELYKSASSETKKK